MSYFSLGLIRSSLTPGACEAGARKGQPRRLHGNGFVLKPCAWQHKLPGGILIRVAAYCSEEAVIFFAVFLTMINLFVLDWKSHF